MGLDSEFRAQGIGRHQHTGRVLITGTFNEDAHPRVRVLEQGLIETGWRVEKINRPLNLPTQDRLAALQNARALTKVVGAIAKAWRELLPRLRTRLRTPPFPDIILIGYLGHFDIIPIRLMARNSFIVLDYLISGQGTAIDRGIGGREKRFALSAVDFLALQCANLVLVDTEENLHDLPLRHREKSVAVHVGADASWFRAGQHHLRDFEAERLRVVFFGLFTPLQGATTIARALQELHGEIDATIIGSGQEEAAVDQLLRGVPNVKRIKWVAAHMLPEIVAQHHVCLGIFGISDKAKKVVPNKVYQGAAAGCLVVTSDTAPQRRVLGKGFVFVRPGCHGELAQTLRAINAQRQMYSRQAQISWQYAREYFTGRAVVEQLSRRLGNAQRGGLP